MAYSYRCVWENNYQWKSRSTFLEVHEGKFPDARLASLSMAWANWKFMGCMYPTEVQTLIETLDEGLPEDVDDSKSSTMNSKSSITSKSNICNAPKSPRKERPLDDVIPLLFNADRKRLGFTLYMTNQKVENPISILYSSAQKSKSTLEFQDNCTKSCNKDFQFSSSVIIDNALIAIGYGRRKTDAKEDAAKRAISFFKANNKVIVKESQHDKCEVVTKRDLIKSAYCNAPKLGEDNIGNKLLRKMGWDGKNGLGKESNTGIIDPIILSGTEGRMGFGTSNTNEMTLNKRTAEEVLMNFIRDGNEKELKFSAELSKEDRATLHKLSQKFGLSHRSFGSHGSRYLVIGKKL